jgi:hypothetical protein
MLAIFIMDVETPSIDIKTRFLLCHICGRQFGTKSLPIHLKTCKQKNTNAKNKNIGEQIKEKDKVVEKEFQKILDGTITKSQYNLFSQSHYQNNAVERGVMIECNSCGRTFNRPDGLSKHRIVCDRDKGGYYSKNKIVEKSPTILKSFSLTDDEQKVNKSFKKQSSPTLPKDEQKLNKNVKKKSTPPEPKAAKANYCVDCGLTLGNNWKFCANCGTKVIEIL